MMTLRPLKIPLFDRNPALQRISALLALAVLLIAPGGFLVLGAWALNRWKERARPVPAVVRRLPLLVSRARRT